MWWIIEKTGIKPYPKALKRPFRLNMVPGVCAHKDRNFSNKPRNFSPYGSKSLRVSWKCPVMALLLYAYSKDNGNRCRNKRH